MNGVPLIGAAAAPDLAVMTYNVRRRLPPLPFGRADRWSERGALLRRLLAAERPSIVGVQEALGDQARFVAASLGPAYRAIGRGRNADGGGEGCPVVYDSARLELLDWNQLALSNTPGVPGSRSWGNPIPRIAVVARFRDRHTAATLRFVNTHLDPFSARSREHSARVLGAMLATEQYPTVFTCDANARTGSRPYRELTAAAGLADAWLAADRRLTPEWNTYSGYRPPRVGGRRIDWLLVGGGIEVREVGINAVRFAGAAASDHEPVQALLRLPAHAE